MADETESDYPPALAIAWGLAPSPRRGPRRELTHEQIVAAALEIADADGLAAVTMQKVATALGFTTMSLYRYVTSKDDLLQLMQDAAMALPEGATVTVDDWREGLVQVTDHMRTVYGARPWALDVPLSFTGVVMPNNLRFADLTFRAMRTLPLPPAQKVGILLSLAMYVRSYAALERDLIATEGTDDPQFTDALAGLLQKVVTPEEFPDLAPVLPEAFVGDDSADSDDDYEFGLARILDGIERYVDDLAAGSGSGKG